MNKKTIEMFAVKAVVEHFGSRVVGSKYLGGGSFGKAYKIMQDIEPHIVVAKAFKINGQHIGEAKGLVKLRECSSIKIPEVYAIVDQKDPGGADFLIMEYIEGVDCFTHFAFLLKSKEKKKAFAAKVVDALIDIHSCKNDKFGDIDNPQYDNWLDYYRPFAKSVLDTALKLNSEGKLNSRITNTLQASYNKFDIIFSEKVKEASIIHGDLNVLNIMADKKTFLPVAFIDPLNSMYADREYDLFQLNNGTGKCFGLYNTYKEKFNVSTYCDIKCSFYALFNEVYCYIKAGTLYWFIMNPLVKNMKKRLQKI